MLIKRELLDWEKKKVLRYNTNLLRLRDMKKELAQAKDQNEIYALKHNIERFKSDVVEQKNYILKNIARVG